ncbi:unknown [Prevotella sp. CAG:487]|nr:unknown [Prevotella sp. CAG:487]
MSRICRPVTETLFVVCPVFMLFKDIASERKESLLFVSRVQLYLMQI